jgi:chromosome segregation ATPase
LQVQAQLLQEREDMARFAADVEAAESEHQQELDSKDALMQECLAAMQAEEQAKGAAQEALRAAKEWCTRLEQDGAVAAAALDDARERCKDLEAERDEAQVRSVARPADLSTSAAALLP